MKSNRIILLLLMVIPFMTSSAKNLSTSASNVAGASGKAVAVKTDKKSLSRQEADSALKELVEQWKNDVRENLRQDYTGKAIHHDTLEMKIWTRLFGQAPEGERSMFISMHGGGSAPHEINEQQWHNQKILYEPSEGLYVAPRAPWDEWNMWFKPGMDELLKKLINAAVVFDGVNPNKVYLMGYSAGGDGVWRMAPRMADTWAAASMMAGHPGTMKMDNLRNLPYMIWCGELDAAYDRNTLDTQKGKELDAMQAADPMGFIHETHIVKGKGHWMDRLDTLAVSWMKQYQRNAYPQKVVWLQDDEILKNDFYWIHVSDLELGKGKKVIVNREGNTISIEQSDYRTLTFMINDEMMNLDKPVVVKWHDKVIFKKRLKRTRANLRQTLYSRNDPAYAFPAMVTVKVEPAP